MYYIYHIPERKKIGVAIDVSRRMREHKWTGFYEILEEYTDIHKVSDREIELQKQYGYKVDTIPYWKSIKMHTFESRSNGGKLGGKNIPYESRLKGFINQPKSIRIENGKKRRKLTYTDAQQIRAEYSLGSITQRQLAKMYGVTRVTIGEIVRNQSYTTP